MHLGGFQKNTLIDFPGHIACLVFTSGCNFRCPYCHNPELVVPGALTSLKSRKDSNHTHLIFCPETHIASAEVKEKDVFSFLERRNGLLNGVAITGGEPALQKDLEEFCLKVKTMGFDVKLDTNGSLPQIIKNLLDKRLVDYVAMDIKSNLAGYEKLAGKQVNISAISRTIKIIMELAPDYEFRTTCVKPFIDKTIMADIGKMIEGASLYVLQQCSRNVNVLNPEFFIDNKPFFSDDELVLLRQDVKDYVQKCTIRNT